MAAGLQPPLVSVITPTKNRLALLQQTLDSVKGQTLAAWEHIVVDDGSNDGTAEMMECRAAADPRVRYIVREGHRTGANVCRNLAIRAAAAPFLVMLDSDDVLDPDCLARRVNVMQRNANLDFVTHQTGIFAEAVGDYGRQLDSQLLGDDLTRFLYFEPPWIITAPTWRRESLLRIGLFDEDLLSWQDVELHVRALCAGCRYVRFPEIDHHVRWQPDVTKVSVEQRRSPNHLEAALDVIARLEAHVRAGPGLNWVRQRALCSLYFFVAERWVDRKDLRSALRAWRSIRTRNLGSPAAHGAGVLLLVLARSPLPSEALVHKWRGWARLRTNPELVPGETGRDEVAPAARVKPALSAVDHPPLRPG